MTSRVTPLAMFLRASAAAVEPADVGRQKLRRTDTEHDADRLTLRSKKVADDNNMHAYMYMYMFVRYMLKLQASGCLQCSVAMKPLLIDVYATLKLEMDCKTKRESNVKPVKREESNQNIRVETYVHVCAVYVRRSRW